MTPEETTGYHIWSVQTEMLCVCHLYHKWAMNSPAAVRELCKTVLQQVCHFKVDVIAGDDNAEAKRYYQKKKKNKIFTILSCRHTKRDAT